MSSSSFKPVSTAMNTYTHFLWAVCLSHWILSRTTSEQQPQYQNRGLVRQKAPSFDRKGALFGSVLPDLPLIATFLVCNFHDRLVAHQHAKVDENGDIHSSATFWTGRLFRSWYFTNKWVEAEHNLFHSPVSLVILISAVYLLWRKGRQNKREKDDTTMEDESFEDELPIEPLDDADLAADAASYTRSSNNTNTSCAKRCCSGCCSCWCSTRFWYWTLLSALFHALCDIPVHHDDGPLLFWPFNWSYRFQSPFSYWDYRHYGKPISRVEHTTDVLILLWLLYRFCKSRAWRHWSCCWRCYQTTGSNHNSTAAAASPNGEMEVMMVENPTRNYQDEIESDETV